ncbi:hypothetical protein [Rhodohalobacter mucosus]|uniref:hypothetical protein n=1 Tax=Rhodohalobacter mucosus TaxID=2079485 RepID=UPI0011B2974C|nr:hypothetical protein [Rhodohalobacter mucosus]
MSAFSQNGSFHFNQHRDIWVPVFFTSLWSLFFFCPYSFAYYPGLLMPKINAMALNGCFKGVTAAEQIADFLKSES